KVKFDQLSAEFSRATTRRYSTSFSLGIKFLHGSLREHVYATYGFARMADEIVDSFAGYDRGFLLNRSTEDANDALTRRISSQSALNSFQETYHRFNIGHDLVDAFFRSMKMDLNQNEHDTISYKEYIFGSAESVGLMCLKVFTEGDESKYASLRY